MDLAEYYAFGSRVVKAFMILSCILLLATILVYAIFHKKLLNYYTKIMLHFSVVLFLAFAFLVVNKFVHLGNVISGGDDCDSSKGQKAIRDEEEAAREVSALVCKVTGMGAFCGCV